MTTIRCFLVFVTLSLVLAGCGGKEDAKGATQVVARVNSAEITVHQINHALARGRGVTRENASQAKREVLERLIDQELAKRQAILKGLDRSHEVVLDMEAAKNEILARAYRESLVDYRPKPAPYEVEAYYRKNPELFAERRIFNLDELNFVGNDAVAAGVREQAARARSLKDIAGWLKSREVVFAASRGVRAAEDIPLEILPKLQRMKEGETQLFAVDGTRFRLIRVVAFQAAPVDEAAAAQPIRQFLINRNAAEVIAKEMKEMRKFAKVEYLGEFAGRPAEAQAAAEPQALTTSEQLQKEQPKN